MSHEDMIVNVNAECRVYELNQAAFSLSRIRYGLLCFSICSQKKKLYFFT